MSPQIFITAFEPYDEWSENASWLALVEFTKSLPTGARIVTRRYPVDFGAVRQRLEKDLSDDFDYALHLGQAPGSARIHLEAIALNVGGNSGQRPESFEPLVTGGPDAFRTSLPVGEWSLKMREQGIPATISHHAGTYLCNATMYLTHYIVQQRRLKTRAAFIHVPLDPSQTAQGSKEIASLPTSVSAAGLRVIVDELIKRGPVAAAALA